MPNASMQFSKISRPIIKSIGLQNFQSIAEYQEIPLSDITLLFGPNSAGKSSIYDAIEVLRILLSDKRVVAAHDGSIDSDLLLRSIKRDSDNKFGKNFRSIPEWIVDVQIQCDCLDFLQLKEIDAIEIFGSNFDLSVELSLRISGRGRYVSSFGLLVDGVLLVKDGRDGFQVGYKNKVIGWLNSVRDADGGVHFMENALKLSDLGSRVFQKKSNEIVDCNTSNFYHWDDDAFPEVVSNFSSDDDDATGDEWEAFQEFAEDYNSMVRLVKTQFLRALSVKNVPASRTIPARKDLLYILDCISECDEWDKPSYPFKLESNKDYKGLAYAILTKKIREKIFDESYQMYSRKAELLLLALDRLNACLRDHLLIDRAYQISADIKFIVDIESIANREYGEGIKYGQALVQLMLVDAKENTFHFDEVGSGLGYSLPVLMAASGTEMSFVQQPELHLHPALQSSIADVFVEAVNLMHARNLIETHSEHIILRLLRRIRQTSNGKLASPQLKLRPDQVSVLYFEPSLEGGTKVRRLRISDDGDFIDKWPGGFFTEREEELFDE